MAPDGRQRLGAAGERLVARFYERAGYEVLDRNWRRREGEIDLVCRRGAVLVVCEVKSRRSERFGTAAEAVTPAKQRRLRRLAGLWLSEHPHLRREGGCRQLRLDVATVTRRGVEVIEGAC